jgi:hypothetical protein
MPEWIWVALVGAVQVIMGWLVVTLRAADQARIAELKQWIQDKEDAITEINEKLLPMENQVKQLEEDRTGIRAWKHLVVDPYIPRAVEEHERRIDRLEGRVFNGERK